jgi:subtilisin family serine protease
MEIIIVLHLLGCDYIDDAGGHGTHVGGTIAGSLVNTDDLSTVTGQYSGVAPNTKLLVLDLGNNGEGLTVCSATCLYSPGYSAGARIHTNSWGSLFTGTGYYSGADVDLYLFQHPDFIIFFAAGNSGTSGDGTVTMDASSKNVVAVGASETTFESVAIGNVAWFSSMGPTYDGRIKPDILAPGDAVMSALSNGNSGPSCG